MSVKTRKVGGSTVLTVPSSIKTAPEYDVYQGADGQIIYTPKTPNPFLDPDYVSTHDFSQKEMFGNHAVGSEVIDDE